MMEIEMISNFQYTYNKGTFLIGDYILIRLSKDYKE